jgi:hypothetical protein
MAQTLGDRPHHRLTEAGPNGQKKGDGGSEPTKDKELLREVPKTNKMRDVVLDKVRADSRNAVTEHDNQPSSDMNKYIYFENRRSRQTVHPTTPLGLRSEVEGCSQIC